MNDTILFDPNTGRKLNPGESVVDKQTGRTLTQGTSFSGTNTLTQPDMDFTGGTNTLTQPDMDFTGGASARFEDMSAADREYLLQRDNAIFNNIPYKSQVQQPGESAEAYAQRIADNPFYLADYSDGGYVPEPVIMEGMYKGLTQTQANAKKQAQGDQQSAMTSYTFNPESLSSSKGSIDKLNISLNELNNSPFTSSVTRDEKKNSILDLTANEIARNFDTAQNFYTTYENNPELQNILKPFVEKGGTVANIASKIKTVSDVSTEAQDTTSYLESLLTKSAENDPFRAQALDALAPENKLVQDEISRISGIAKEYRDLYFGTEKTLGIIDEKRKLAEDKKALIEQKELNDKTAERERLALAIEKNNSDVEIMQAEIEENRVKSKNIMTKTLAKLGALKTTGNAPLALGTLEQKYQKQKVDLDTKLKFANRELEIKSAERINNLAENADEAILKISEDLSKSNEEITKEVFKIQTDTANRIFTESSKAAQELRKTADTYRKESESNSKEYQTNFFKLAGMGVNVNSIDQLILPDGSIDTSKLTNAMFAKKTTGSGTGGSSGATSFTKTQLQKLEQAGISPQDRQAALNFLFGDGTEVDNTQDFSNEIQLVKDTINPMKNKQGTYNEWFDDKGYLNTYGYGQVFNKLEQRGVPRDQIIQGLADMTYTKKYKYAKNYGLTKEEVESIK